MSSPSESDWAWFAGIMDGEGHISVVGTRGRKKPGALTRRIAITNCNLPLLLEICRLFGGRIHVHTPPKGTNRQQFQWYCYGDRMRWVLTGVMSRLIAKREEAEVCLAFDHARDSDYGQKMSPAFAAKCVELIARMAVLRAKRWKPEDVPDDVRSRKGTPRESPPGYIKHCRRGHPYADQTVRRLTNGGRRCRFCERAADKRKRAKRKRLKAQGT